MFATSTKTATFLPTGSPIRDGAAARAPVRAPRSTGPSPAGPCRREDASHERTELIESLSLPPGPLGGIVRPRRLDGRATLVGRRSEGLREEGPRHVVRVHVRCDDEEIDRADVAAGPYRGADREDRAAHDLPSPFGDEDAGVRQVDQLPEQIRGIERRPGAAGADPLATQGDELVDVRDPGCSDRVFHAAAGTSIGWRHPDATAPVGADRGRSVAADRTRRERASLEEPPRVAPTGVAIGAPSPIIRHRFGGNLRAAETGPEPPIAAPPLRVPRSLPPPFETDCRGPRRRTGAGLRRRSRCRAGRRSADQGSLRETPARSVLRRRRDEAH